MWAQNHETSKWQSCDLNPGFSDSKSLALFEKEKGFMFFVGFETNSFLFSSCESNTYLEVEKEGENYLYF